MHTVAFSPVDRGSEVTFGTTITMFTLGVMLAGLVTFLGIFGARTMSIAHAIWKVESGYKKYR